MGSATTICSDKTGTLTLNQMTVVETYVGQNKIDPPEDGLQYHSTVSPLLNEGISQNTAGSVFSSKDGACIEVSGSPTEKDILHWGVKIGMNFDVVRSQCHNICRVEDIVVEGSIEGSVVHFQWVRAVVIKPSGSISASGLGCIGGAGHGKILNDGTSGGGGHGGRGGDGYYNNSIVVKGGVPYGNPDFPCEFGSGIDDDSLGGATVGGGIIVMGSLEHSLSSLSIYGSLTADGESFGENIRKQDVKHAGGGSGGSVLLFVDRLKLGESSSISTVGGYGSQNAGGGGVGRIHFHWSDIIVGDEYQCVASVNGSINIGGGIGKCLGQPGNNGTITGIVCPQGLYGIFCEQSMMWRFQQHVLDLIIL